MKNLTLRFVTVACMMLIVAACSSGGGGSTDTDNSSDMSGTEVGALDPTKFIVGALASAVTIEDCELSSGASTTCYRIVTVSVPADAAIGPFCPTTITSTAQEGGIWFDGSGTVYDIDGPFVENLASLYGDSNWQLYDPDTGFVDVTATEEEFNAAAQPNVPVDSQNQCIAGQIEWVDGGVSTTYLIPTTPVPLDTPGAINSDVGVSLNGIPLAPPAPVSDILAAYTIAAFDDCGGHINPVAGYHYHGSVGCTETGEESTNLDECRGETVASSDDAPPGGSPPGR